MKHINERVNAANINLRNLCRVNESVLIGNTNITKDNLVNKLQFKENGKIFLAKKTCFTGTFVYYEIRKSVVRIGLAVRVLICYFELIPRVLLLFMSRQIQRFQMLMNERSKSNIRITNLRNTKVRRLVIPSTRKFDQLKPFVQVKVDILVITESELDKYSTMNQF